MVWRYCCRDAVGHLHYYQISPPLPIFIICLLFPMSPGVQFIAALADTLEVQNLDTEYVSEFATN